MLDIVRFAKYFMGLKLGKMLGRYDRTYPTSLGFRWKLWNEMRRRDY